MKTLLLLALALFAPTAAAQEGPPVFREMEFGPALDTALAEEKVLFVQFYATWDPESRRLDATLWKDEQVIAWLEENTIPIRVDWDRSKQLVKEFELSGFPASSILIGSDRRELDRIVHLESLDSDVFLKGCERIVSGDTAVQVARAALEANPGDAMRSILYADALMARGRQREALDRYLEAWDSRDRSNPEFLAVRRSQLISRIYALHSSTMPTRAYLEQRASAALSRVEVGVEGVTTLVGPEASQEVQYAELGEQAADYAAIMRALGRMDHSYELFDRVANEPYAVPVQKALSEYVLAFLSFDKRYEQVLAFVPDPEGLAQEAAAKFSERMKEAEAASPKSSLWRFRKGFARDLREATMPTFEALVGAGRLDEARQVANITLGVDPSIELYTELIRRAKLAGGIELATAIAEEGKLKFSTNLKLVNKIKRTLEKS